MNLQMLHYLYNIVVHVLCLTSSRGLMHGPEASVQCTKPWIFLLGKVRAQHNSIVNYYVVYTDVVGIIISSCEICVTYHTP